jgi:hypothetical protein
MLKRFLILFTVAVGLGLALAITGWAIRNFGQERTAVFVGVASLLALTVAAVATATYAIETRNITKATLETARQQERVAKIMEEDLRFRLAPKLTLQPCGGDSRSLKVEVRNIASGFAVGLQATVKFLTSERLAQVSVFKTCLGPQETTGVVGIQRNTDEGIAEIEITCTDSAGSADYRFTWNEHDTLKSEITRRSIP